MSTRCGWVVPSLLPDADDSTSSPTRGVRARRLADAALTHRERACRACHRRERHRARGRDSEVSATSDLLLHADRTILEHDQLCSLARRSGRTCRLRLHARAPRFLRGHGREVEDVLLAGAAEADAVVAGDFLPSSPRTGSRSRCGRASGASALLRGVVRRSSGARPRPPPRARVPRRERRPDRATRRAPWKASRAAHATRQPRCDRAPWSPWTCSIAKGLNRADFVHRAARRRWKPVSHSSAPCSACARHVRSTDARCPFCGGSRVVAQPRAGFRA